MNKFSLIILSVIVSFFIAQPCLAGSESRDLTIVFSGDMRGEIENCRCPKDDFGGLPRRYKYIAGVRDDVGDILLLDAGDVLSLFTPDFGKKEIALNAAISFEAMNMMGYDVMNVGESDLVLGEQFLREKENGLSFPLISTNIVDKHTGEPLFKPYVIRTMENGLKVAVLGLVNERYVINSDTLDITPSKEAALKLIPLLKAQSDVVIVLSHLGLPYSQDLAKSVEGIDVILSGHWDVESQEPVEIGNTLVMPATYYSRKIGRLDLEVKDGDVYSYRWESTPLGPRYDGAEEMKRLIFEMTQGPVELNNHHEEQIEETIYEGPLKVFVFYSPGCRACMEIDRDLLPVIEAKYGEKITVERYDITLSKNYQEMVRLEKLYGVEGGYVPEVVVSGYVLMGKEEISARLDTVIQKALMEQSDVKKNRDLAMQAAAYQPPVDSFILSRFESFSVYAVMTAGLLDGVNPCAFTTIVFFISFLAFVGYKKRQMYFAGLAFTLAVFITYLLIGLGIFRFLRALRGFNYLAYAVTVLVGALAFLLGFLNLLDYWRFKKTKDVKDIILKLPVSVKNRIHSVIGRDFRDGEDSGKRSLLRITWVALTAGFTVSVLESLCTGQIYLPTIAYVLRMPHKSIPALIYLLIYNLAFIIPLVAVLILALFGGTSKAFANFMERRLGAVKLSTALLFFALGTLIIIFR